MDRSLRSSPAPLLAPLVSLVSLVALGGAAGCCCPALRAFDDATRAGGGAASSPSAAPEPPAPDPAPVFDEAQYPRTPLPLARRGVTTALVSDPFPESDVPPSPPAGVLELARYPAPSGALRAYVSPDPRDGQRHPAVVWVHGGWGGLSDHFWQPAPRTNDQSASALRQRGIVLALPSFRGQNDNPGRYEGFWGELDDLVAFVDWVSTLPYVDPARVYVAGHSTGGTMALLASVSTDRPRAFFGFGAAPGACNYPPENLPFASAPDGPECNLRSWMLYVAAMRKPSFYIEGANAPGAPQIAAAIEEDRRNVHPPLSAVLVPGADHFEALEPLTRLLAQKILADTGPTSNITFGAADLAWVQSEVTSARASPAAPP